MGRRKRITAEKKKELRKHIVFSRLRNIRISCRKIRIVANLIRNMDVIKALSVLKYNNRRKICIILSKILLSTISNWKNKNKNSNEYDLYIKEIKVDGARIIKRIQPAPQGRSHRIKKHSSHINITLQKNIWDIK